MRNDLIPNHEQTGREQVREGIPRTVEIIVVLLCIVVAFPLTVFVLLAIKLSSRGPVIFRQSRVGLNGRIFTIHKFRTMLCGLEGFQFTAADDSRVTRLGRLLRRTKLDEFPELWNVLKGDMSLVGPRPEVPRYVNLEDELWRKVLTVKPGLTDPMTLRMLDEEQLLSTVESDRESYYIEKLQPYKIAGHLEYLRHRSWKTDLSVLFDTSLTFIFRRKR